MRELKATPGPWVAVACNVRHSGGARRPIFDDGRWMILPESDMERLPLAEVDSGDDHHEPTRKQAEHDAHLIAAAPDLYEALEMVLEMLDMDGFGKDAAIDVAHAALAKARGEQP